MAATFGVRLSTPQPINRERVVSNMLEIIFNDGTTEILHARDGLCAFALIVACVVGLYL